MTGAGGLSSSPKPVTENWSELSLSESLRDLRISRYANVEYQQRAL